MFGCTREVRDRLVELKEIQTNLVAQLLWLGFRRAFVPYERRPRLEGSSGWTAGKKFRYALDSIFAFTDLPIRNLYYPDHGRETGRGVLLASYTWAEDAQRWGSLKPDARIIQALDDVAEIHPQITQEFEVGASWMWHDDEFAGGAFALFDPGQQTLLHEEIVKPEGRIHFAGEHASLYHAWIQGAFESGLRAAVAVHQAP